MLNTAFWTLAHGTALLSHHSLRHRLRFRAHLTCRAFGNLVELPRSLVFDDPDPQERDMLILRDPHTRRDFLRLGALGLALPASTKPRRAKSVIQLFLWGGPAQQET